MSGPRDAAYLCEHAWLGGEEAATDVLVEVAGGRVVGVTPGHAGPLPPGATRLAGLTLPGLADVHSHAFHRALRGRTQGGTGSFWTWREQMYEVAARLDPDSLYLLARAAYAEMALAGITVVGEFHYLHHGPGGTPYDDPNAMGHALVAAARDTGIRVTLLDALYLAGGIGEPLTGVQVRFGDRDAEAWAARVDALVSAYAGDVDVVVGAAVHSVRAVPPDAIAAIAAWADSAGAPLHAHLSEQPAENDACLAAYGCTPTRLLADQGALGPSTTVVHATHLSADDVEALGAARSFVCFCPTTERDLADGIGPAPALVAAGARLTLGSDSQAVIDLLEEARAVELDERLASRTRGTFTADELLRAATGTGHAALGRRGDAAAGVVAPGSPADLVTVRLDSVRTAGTGTGPATAVFAATAADVHHVVSGGQVVVRDGEHAWHGDVGPMLAEAVQAVLR